MAGRARRHPAGGALVVERNVLEWRSDPRCDARLPVADRYDLRVIVFCSEGYTSSLAEASLRDLGLLFATGYNRGVQGVEGGGAALGGRGSGDWDTPGGVLVQLKTVRV